jgi:beta-aspartyl-peptidase (threonine type)
MAVPGWSLILHGGAKEVPAGMEAANRHGCLAALEAGTDVLRGGGSALDAIEAAVRVLEDDPTFNAGYGSVLNAAGDVEMDAAFMDGATLDIGAVAAIRGVRHPASVARLMLQAPPILLAAGGALRFAAEQGAELCEPAAMIAPQPDPDLASRLGHDTVGCVARDSAGNIAACTSTGGLPGSAVGRVGDSALPGCGFYADNGRGGIALSGDGEYIARMLLAGHAMRVIENASAQVAAEQAIAHLGRIGGEAGAVVLDRHGGIGWAHNSMNFAVAYAASGFAGPRCFLAKHEQTGTIHHA